MGKRSYAAVPYEYLKTMQKLSDAEFGRLMRGLLEYSENGTIPELSGREDMFWDTVQVKEEQYQASFERVDSQNSERAKKAASARWAETDSDAQACTSMLKDAQACSRMLDDAQGCLESQFKYKNKNKENISPNGEIKRARKATKKAPEPPTLDEVKAYCSERNSTVDPVQFWEYFDNGDWKDSEGKPVLAWKQKLLTWEKHERSRPAQKRTHMTTAAEYKQMDKRVDFSVLDTPLDSI